MVKKRFLARLSSCLSTHLCASILPLVLSACGGDKGSGPPSAPRTGPEAFLAGFKLGDSRLLLREFKAVGREYGHDLYALAEIRIEKDTVIEGAPAKAFSLTASTFYPESTHVGSERRFLVAQGDSLNLYWENEGNTGFLFGLLKRGAYDTARFWDKTAEWVFPLSAGSRWLIRPPGGVHWSLEKEWMGKEDVEFDGRPYACDVFVLHSAVKLKTWVASVGMLKAEIDYGPTIFTDSEDNEVDTALVSQERYELVKLNPTAAETEAAKVKYRSLSWQKLP